MAQQQITLLGCGKMGSAMLEGWLADTNLDANFTIIEPDQSHLGWLQGQKAVLLYADCAAAIADGAPVSTMIVLAVKPQMMDGAIAGLGVMKHADCAYLSIAAGISTGWLKQRLGDTAIVIRASRIHRRRLAKALPRFMPMRPIRHVIWQASFWRLSVRLCMFKMNP